MTEDYIIVGKLGKTRGVIGEIYVTSFSDFPDRFVGMDSILVKGIKGWERMEIEFSRLYGPRPALKFKGIDTPEAAALLTNSELAITKDELVVLPEGSFYIFDIIGCEVFDADSGEKLGVIDDVEQYPANDAYVIKTNDNDLARIAVVKQFIKSVDIKTKKVTIDPSGLMIA